MIFLLSTVALAIYMSAWWFVGRRQGRLDVADTAWGGGFIITALLAVLVNPGSRTWLMLILVLVWGLRLIWHISSRSAGRAPDPRYEALSSKWNPRHFWRRAYVSIFLTQGLLILIVAMPIQVAGIADPYPLGWLSALAVLLWVAGFSSEAIADNQLGRFIRSSQKGGILQSGLWKYSRHPNYFGELVQWWAIGLLALGAPFGWLGLVGPLVLTILIVFVSGIPPIEKRHSSKPGYAEYRHRTSILIPLPRRR